MRDIDVCKTTHPSCYRRPLLCASAVVPPPCGFLSSCMCLCPTLGPWVFEKLMEL